MPTSQANDLRSVLAAVLERDGGNACRCINHSRAAEREYENGTCPHQRAAALLAEGGGEAVARDREADRARFPDAAFNDWLDTGISDAGHTVWDAIGDTAAAWAGWEARQFAGDAVLLTECCGREECGGECGNNWLGMSMYRKPQADDTTPPPQPRGEGMVLVPREPTEAMVEAARGFSVPGYCIAAEQWPSVYRAMLAAAPGEGSGEHRAATAEEEAELDAALGVAKITLRLPVELLGEIDHRAQQSGLVRAAWLRMTLAEMMDTPPPASQSAKTLREVVGDPRVGVTIQTDASILMQNASQSAPSGGGGELPELPEPLKEVVIAGDHDAGLRTPLEELFTAEQMLAIRDAGIEHGRRLATAGQEKDRG